MNRVLDTFKVCYKVFMIRTFGTYMHSSWDGKADYSVYKWKDETYYIPQVRNS